MTHEEILAMLGDYVDYLIANSSAEAPMWNIEKVRSGKPNKWNYIDGCMITACLSLYKTTGDEKYLTWFERTLDYCKEHFSDPEYGDWYGYLRRDGKPTMPACKGSTFKGPFHLPRMLVMCDQMLGQLLAGQ